MFSLHTGIKALYWPSDPVPLNTKHYQVILTQHRHVPTNAAPYWLSILHIFLRLTYECCLRKAIFVAFHFDPIKIRFLSLVKSKSSLAERLVPHWDLSQGGPIKKDTLHQKPFGWRPSSKNNPRKGRWKEKKTRCIKRSWVGGRRKTTGDQNQHHLSGSLRQPNPPKCQHSKISQELVFIK